MRRWFVGVAFAVVAGCGGGGNGGGGDAGSSTTSVPVGDFTEQWSAQLDGIEAAWAAEDVVYATAGADPGDGEGSLAVTAIEADDGSTRWTKSVTDDGSWSPSFVLFPTRNGALVSYEDAEGGHLVLLEGESGDVEWDTAIEGYAYDLFGEVAGGIGLIALDEGANEFVNLADGKIVADEFEWMVFDDQLAVVEDATLRVGVDPFDPDAKTDDIDLAGLHPSHVQRVGDTLVALDGDDLVGIADGKELFRVASEVGAAEGFGPLDDRHVAVIGDDLSRPLNVFRVEEDAATSIGAAPADFDVGSASAGAVGGDPLIAGFIDADQSSDVTGEIGQVVLLEVADSSVSARASTELPALSELQFAGGRIVVRLDDGYRVLSAEDLTEVATIASGDGSGFHIAPSYLVTIDSEADKIIQWR